SVVVIFSCIREAGKLVRWLGLAAERERDQEHQRKKEEKRRLVAALQGPAVKQGMQCFRRMRYFFATNHLNLEIVSTSLERSSCPNVFIAGRRPGTFPPAGLSLLCARLRRQRWGPMPG